MSDQFTLGQHEEAINTLLQRTERIETAVSEIQLALAEKRGERRVALWAASAAGGFVAFVFMVVGKILKVFA